MILLKNLSFLLGGGIFIKPLLGSYGKDAYIFDSKLDSDIKELFEKLTIDKNSWGTNHSIAKNGSMEFFQC